MYQDWNILNTKKRKRKQKMNFKCFITVADFHNCILICGNGGKTRGRLFRIFWSLNLCSNFDHTVWIFVVL